MIPNWLLVISLCWLTPEDGCQCVEIFHHHLDRPEHELADCRDEGQEWLNLLGSTRNITPIYGCWKNQRPENTPLSGRPNAAR